MGDVNIQGTGTEMERPARGFTLVELLVVIVIIGILMALLIPAVGSAIYSAKVARIGVEIGQLQSAMQAFRTENQAYPPDFSGPLDGQFNNAPANLPNDLIAIDTFMARKFRYRAKGVNGADAPPNVTSLDPAEALVFWLSGFSSSPQQPLKGPNKKPFFEFDKSRLQDVDNDGYPEYYPPGATAPYLYISSDSYKALSVQNLKYGDGVIKPYVTGFQADTSTKKLLPVFADADKYQIISSGLDNYYGTPMVANPPEPTKMEYGLPYASSLTEYPTGLNLSEPQRDNITSFSEGKTLEKAMP